MDFKLLNSIMIEHLADLPINKYTTNFQGTLMLANHHISKLDDCRSVKASKFAIKMKYKNELFGSIYGQTPTSNKVKAKEISKDKLATELALKDAGIRTSDSIGFGVNQYEQAKKYVEDSGKSYVFKPSNLNGGRGITLNVDSSNFDQAWKFAETATRERKKEFHLIVQEFISGIETRFLVIEKQFNSAILRVPANVIGNGNNTIDELIAIKNKQRTFNPHLKVLPIKVDERVINNLNNEGLSLDSVPDSDQVIYLHKSSNISLGGDSYEISHLVNNAMIQAAESAVQAIPGLSTAGVDMIYKSLDDRDPYVLELNPDANLRMHHYPYKGTPKEPVFDLIDAMLADFKLKNNID